MIFVTFCGFSDEANGLLFTKIPFECLRHNNSGELLVSIGGTTMICVTLQGFADKAYRDRRKSIAEMAFDYKQ